MTIHHSGLLGRSVSSKSLGQTAFWSAMLCFVPIVTQASTAQAATPVTPNLPAPNRSAPIPATPPVAPSVPIVATPVAPTIVAAAPSVLPPALPIADVAPQVASSRLAQTASAVSIRAFLHDRAVNTGTEARQLLESEQPSEPVGPTPISIAETHVDEVGSLADSGAESLRRKLLIKRLAVGRDVAYAPGSTAGGPTAFGADFGDAYSGLAFANRRPTSDTADAAFSTGFGLGDARRTVGLEVNVSSGSIAKFGSNGDLGLKLHRNLPRSPLVGIRELLGVRPTAILYPRFMASRPRSSNSTPTIR
jgi:hypothetical protein